MVIPAGVRRASSRSTPAAEAPNEACGLSRCATASPSATSPAATPPPRPYRFELEVDPESWFLEDDGYELAVFHSHLSSPPRPSRTDVENIGLWQGRPYVILSLRTGDLAAWGSTADRAGRARAAASRARPTGGSAAAPPPPSHWADREAPLHHRAWGSQTKVYLPGLRVSPRRSSQSWGRWSTC